MTHPIHPLAGTADEVRAFEAAAAPAAVAVPDERAAFETWVASVDTHPLDRLGDGYNWNSIQAKWQVWQARAALAAAPAAPVVLPEPAVQVPAAQAGPIIEKLLELARIVDRAVEDWGESHEDGSSTVIFNKDEADALDAILEYFDNLLDGPDNGVIESGPTKAARILRALLAGVSAPVLYVSKEQLDSHRDPEGPDSFGAGRYLPARITPKGKFTTPLFAVPAAPFQARVQPWLLECFGELIAGDREERNHRFLEEALELVQSLGCTASEAHQLVDYVFGRPVGEPAQEAGGVMVTLAALCLANNLDMHACGETELARIWTKVEAIRAKQAAKPKHSPLPEAPAADALDAELKKVKQAYTELASMFHDQVVAQQAAWIEWQHGKGAEEGMRWIENGLCGPGHIPDEEAPYGTEAQAWFDANQSNPFPTCPCGRPSNILWMGYGFCSNEHYDAHRAATAAQAAAQGGE